METAKEAARIGGGVLMESLANYRASAAAQKQEFDFVTEVDLKSEAAIKGFITKTHPDHRILAEESGGDVLQADYVWVVDPLDGTKNYIHKFPVFAVSVALQHKEEIIAGAILDPTRDELFYAQQGSGAFLNDIKIGVSQTNDFAKCLLATGFPFRNKELTTPYFQSFTSLFEEVSDIRRAGAAAIDLAYVACGRLDGFWEIGLNVWDIAAGALIIEEAGGQVSDIFGEGRYLVSGNIVASNSHIHEKILSKTRVAFKDVF